MIDNMIQFQNLFFEEAAEHLDSMEKLLLALDIEAPEQDQLDTIFRSAHSIKGGAGTFGFNDLTEVTHVLETLLDKIRNHEIALRREMIDVFLQAGDVLRDQLGAHLDKDPVDPERIKLVISRLQSLTAAPLDPALKTTGVSTATAESVSLLIHTIRYQPRVQDPELAERLLEELSNLGAAEYRIESGDDAAMHYVYTLRSSTSGEEVSDIFAFIAQPDEFSLHSEALSSGPPALATAAQESSDESYGLFSDEPETGTLDSPPTDDGFGFFEPLPEPTAELPGFASKPIKTGVSSAPSSKAAETSASESSIRVSIEKVDQLINLVGELVITQAMLVETVSHLDPLHHERLLNGMAQLDRNTRSLQESVMSIRMMPMSFVFGRFPRLVRDLAGKLGKDIELVTVGESTELDKGLIEKIVDPLTHLIRNSLDHGIETPEKREASGKPRKGTLTLRAGHKGGNIIIEVEDDGGGLSRERILDKARERGLPASEAMTDQEVWQLIFAPGFSTAEAVTDVSGRGVGMDVVKRNIDALGGRVEITSRAAAGTTVSIQLPLTLAILDGMSVAVGEEVFIIPLSHIAESLQPAPADIRNVSGGSGQGQLIHVRGEYLPLVPLYRVFNLVPRSEQPTHGILVIVDTGSGRMAFFVDDLLGQHQVVIKSLDANYRKVPGIAGATIMGDGKVALILDVAGVARLAQS